MKTILNDTRRNGDQQPWRPHKHKSKILAASYYRISQKTGDEALYRASARVLNCAEYIDMAKIVTPDGNERRKLVASYFCRDRLCPMCQWRKSLVMFHQLSQTMDYIENHPQKYGQIRCLFLTLTVKNIHGEDLNNTLDEMFAAWKRFSRLLKKRQSIKGSYRALEVTINEQTGEYHPHFHVLLLVTPDYFKADYMKTADYAALWRTALGVDYTPNCWINKTHNSTPKAIAEVAKYTVKPGDWLSNDPEKTDEHIQCLRVSLRNRRLVSFTGALKDARKELRLEDIEKADLVNTDKEQIRGDLVECIERYRWSVGVGSFGRDDYELTETRQALTTDEAGYPTPLTA